MMKKSKENIETKENPEENPEKLNSSAKSVEICQKMNSAAEDREQKFQNSSPVCFAESDEVRDDYRTDS